MNMKNKEIIQEENVAIKINNLGKQYKLGTIGGGTLSGDLKRWWARIRGKEDPFAIIGEDSSFEHYGENFWALKNINLTVKKGEAVGIIGHNGAGKSTLLKLLSRVTAPTSGEAVINGRIASMLEVGTGFHPELTGRENIYMNGAILGMTRAEVESKIQDIIEFSECEKFIDTPVKRYSSGMYVKLAFAVAAHLDSDIMIMDEVLAVGDVKFQKKCLGKMDGAAHSEGKTILYVSHNMATIRQLCNRCVVLDHGTIVYDGDVDKAIEIYSGIEKGESDIVYDLDNVKRPSLDHGKVFRLTRFEFLNNNKFKVGEKMRFSLSWQSERRFDAIELVCTVMSLDEQRAGTSISNKFMVDSEGKTKKNFEFDISNIAEGSYKMSFDVQEVNDYGTHISYDHPMQNVYFDIERGEKQDGMIWQSKYYGFVRLNRIKEIEA